MKDYMIIDTDNRITNPTYVEVNYHDKEIRVSLKCDFTFEKESFFIGKNITETKRGWTVIASHLDAKNHKLFYPRERFKKVFIN